MNKVSLVLKSLRKSYDGKADVLAFDRLEIRQGEFVSFLGPSGSGKTTTLMIVGGFEAPTEGEVILHGAPITAVPAHKRNIGIVFQNYALFPHMSVGKNIRYPLKMRKLAAAKAREQVARVLKMVGLEGFANRFPAELSGGQQQRVALARALVFQPELVLLDEPFGALDKNLREQMQIELKRIHKETGATMVFVTHDQAEAMVMSDRIVVFSNGKIEQIGTPDEIYNRPKTRFVADFIGDSNLIGAELLADGSVRLDGLGAVGAATANGFAPGCYLGLIRPENIGVDADATATAGYRFVVAEKFNYGDMAILIGQVDGVRLRVKQPAMRVASVGPGDSVRLSVPAAAVHLIAE